MNIKFFKIFDSDFSRKKKFESKFFKKNPMQLPDRVLPICKLPFPNGSYHNGVCRELWAYSVYYYQVVHYVEFPFYAHIFMIMPYFIPDFGISSLQKKQLSLIRS